ncbi:hypothetical protein TRFO_38025 [Tritrichomonas foetus]|uniref:Uncharacterized protein n=1 Tax=Tritrichomonas foetus TaxID=1144522 RepID=A0A1J4J9G2_9EUKA|nr:hypothetical protein TRFO_38025 [Tritrichomonas foetus]|eukprot:OHS95822.1 hypothetical protein TRFO_38025 [Tritrichomonas foetus]
MEHGSPSTKNSSSLSNDNARLRSKNKELKSRMKLLESKYRQNSESLESELSSTRLEDQETRDHLITTVKNLESKLNEQTKANNNLAKINKQLQTQISTFLSYVGNHANRDLKNLNEASSLYSELSSESESNNQKIRDLERQNSSLSSQLEESADVARSKSTESAKLKKRLRKMKQATLNEPEMANEIANEVAQKLTKSHNKKVKELQNTIESQKAQIKQLQAQVERAERNASNRGTKSDDNGREEIYKANLALLNDRVQSAEQTAAETQKQYEILQEENQQLADRGNLLNDKLEEAKETIAIKEQNINDLKQKVKQCKQAIQNLKDEMKLKETEAAELDTTVHELQIRISELENEKQMMTLNQPKVVNEPTKQYKDKIEMLESRIASFEELYEKQSQEICELVEQRKQMISSLNQVDEFLATNDAHIQKLEKENTQLAEENKTIKETTTSEREKDDEEFIQAFEDSLEIIPPSMKDQMKEIAQNSDSKAELLKNYISLLVEKMNEVEYNAQVAENQSMVETMRKRYIALLNHLENAHKFLRSIANSQAASNSDEITREEFLTACARLGKYIEEQRVEFPIEDFVPSVFEPSDLNDPQKIANIFLDFVKNDELEESPTMELFTLFMCVSQVNLILMNNIDANAEAIQQAARISQLDDAHVQHIRELESWKNAQMENNENLSHVLRKLVEDPQDDYEKLVEQVITTVNPDDIQTPTQVQELHSKIDALEEDFNNLQTKIEQSQAKEENKRAHFCKEADNMVNDLTKQAKNEEAKFNEEKAALMKQIEQLQSNQSNERNTYENRLQKQQRKLAKRDDLINTLRSENESLTQRSIDLQGQLGQHQSRVDEDNGTIQILKQQLQQTRDDLDRMTSHKQHYKQRLIESDAANSSTLAELKQRSEQLNQKYANTISELQKQLQQTSEELIKAQNEIDGFSSKKRELQEQVAKLQMAKRTAEMKLKAADDALVRERASSEAKQNTYALALKSKSDATIEELHNEIEKCRNTFNRVLTEEFHVSLDDQDVEENNNDNNKYELTNLLEKVDEQLSLRKDEQFIINDAFKLRRVMKIDKKTSLFQVYNKLTSELDTEKKRADEAESFANVKSNEKEKVLRDSKKLERSALELNEWTIWSRAMLRQLSDAASSNPPSSEVRFRLEEALLASISQRTIRRKMEILRTEKKLFLTQKPSILNRNTTSNAISNSSNSNSQSSKKNRVTSIRPMMLSLIFTGKLQQLSGNLPSRFNGMTKANQPPQTAYDRKAHRPLVPFESQ